MNRKSVGLWMIATGLLSIATSAWACPSDWAARIERVTCRDCEVDLAGGGRRTPRPYMRLAANDRLVVRGSGSIDVSGPRGLRVVDSANSPLVIRPTDLGPLAPASSRFLCVRLEAWSGPRRAIPEYTIPRSGGAKPSADALEPPSEQFIPEDYDRAGFVWRHAAAQIRWVGAPHDRDYPQTRHTVEVVEIPPKGDGAIELIGTEIRWSVRRAPSASAPLPPWQRAGGQQPASDSERVARAVWLLLDGPVSWRAFALAELADLSNRSEAASEVITAIKTGELDELPKPSA